MSDTIFKIIGVSAFIIAWALVWWELSGRKR